MSDWMHLAGLALKISIALQVLAIGLGTTWSEETYLFRNPGLLWRSILARNVLVPAIAVLLIKTLSLHPAVAIAIGVLSLTPTPPLLPKAQLKAGARSEYVLGLMVSQSVLAIVLVPITIEIMDKLLGASAHFSPAKVTQMMVMTIFIPLGLGMLGERFLPGLRRFAPNLMATGTLLLVIGAIPLLLLAWRTFPTLISSGALMALAAFIIASTAAGDVLGGPKPEDRTALALASAARHPAVALAITRENFPEQTPLVAGAVILYLILRVVLALPLTRQAHRMEERAVLPQGS